MIDERQGPALITTNHTAFAYSLRRVYVATQFLSQAQLAQAAALICKANLSQKKCEPCEAAAEAMQKMGLDMRMDWNTAKKYCKQIDPRWQIVEDGQKRLRIRKAVRTKNFTKALELFQRVAQVAEAEGHHPDLHLEGWNNVTIELWTHARDGLSENDFIVASKLDSLALEDLLSKKQPPVPSSS
eukprot:gene13736-13857_t